jgi:hypothetical protein
MAYVEVTRNVLNLERKVLKLNSCKEVLVSKEIKFKKYWLAKRLSLRSVG